MTSTDKKCCKKCSDYAHPVEGPCMFRICPCHTEPATSEARLIEQCVGVMGNPAYQGSYAAPREAFRTLLAQARAEGAMEEREAILARIEATRLLEAAFSPQRLSEKLMHNRALDKIRDFILSRTPNSPKQ